MKELKLQCVFVCLGPGTCASHAALAAYMDLLWCVNRTVRGTIVPAANTAAMQLTVPPLKSQIPAAIISDHPAFLQSFSVLAACTLHVPAKHFLKPVMLL